MNFDDWVKVAEIATGIGTVLLAGITVLVVREAKNQLRSSESQLSAALLQVEASKHQVDAARSHLIELQRQERDTDQRQINWETLRACSDYDKDPILEAACERVWRIAENSADKARPYAEANTRDLILVMNYLDRIAIAVSQKMYNPDIVKAHLRPVIEKMIDVICKQRSFDMTNFRELEKLRQSWHENPTEVSSRNDPG